jgi:hypothetical protein
VFGQGAFLVVITVHAVLSVCGWGVDAPLLVLQGPPRLCCTWLHAHGMPLLSWCGVRCMMHTCGRCMMHTSAHYPYMRCSVVPELWPLAALGPRRGWPRVGLAPMQHCPLSCLRVWMLVVGSGQAWDCIRCTLVPCLDQIRRQCLWCPYMLAWVIDIDAHMWQAIGPPRSHQVSH